MLSPSLVHGAIAAALAARRPGQALALLLGVGPARDARAAKRASPSAGVSGGALAGLTPLSRHLASKIWKAI